ncbi:MAG: hypothetical protein KF715_02035 [Candidatus Didemnitutus sp.]|nr:hypothetical protein [Candidatus Didemnitutus sp.]
MENNPPAPTGLPPPFPKPPSFAPPPGVITPKPASGGAKPLVLPRRASPLLRAQEAAAATSAATVEARKSIDAILAQSRTPWGGETPQLSGTQVDELQKAIRALEAKLAERDLAVNEAQAKLAERERELAEAEALLAARERVVEAARKQTTTAGPAVSGEQVEAMRKLKEELDRQEAAVKEQREALREREEFLEQSEARLFSKMQEQQEKETELEQLADDLKRKARQLGLGGDEPPEIREKA